VSSLSLSLSLFLAERISVPREAGEPSAMRGSRVRGKGGVDGDGTDGAFGRTGARVAD
jgi:hypothetical protein